MMFIQSGKYQLRKNKRGFVIVNTEIDDTHVYVEIWVVMVDNIKNVCKHYYNESTHDGFCDDLFYKFEDFCITGIRNGFFVEPIYAFRAM